MRLVRYSVAISLDGYIAGPNGEFDWILMDPDIDFSAFTARFDTHLVGRKSYEAMQRMGGAPPYRSGVREIVFSRMLDPADHPKIALETDAVRVVKELREQPGKEMATSCGTTSVSHTSLHGSSRVRDVRGAFAVDVFPVIRFSRNRRTCASVTNPSSEENRQSHTPLAPSTNRPNSASPTGQNNCR